MALETPSKLLTFLRRAKGRIQNSAKAIKTLERIIFVGTVPVISLIISGAKSPITTKNAIHVPNRKPIMHISIINLPYVPNIEKALKNLTKILNHIKKIV